MCKRLLTFVLLTLCFSTMIAQPRKVIVVMADKYDDANIAVKTQYMTKAQRRDFVISERKSFCMASQQNVIDFLNGFKDENSVSDIKQFWSFNGFACVADEYVVEQLRGRKDVAAVYYDEMRKMLPDMAEAKPVNSKDNAWHVDKVNAPAVWNYNGTTGYTGSDVVVAVIDSGVDYNHVDIAGSMWDGGDEYPHHGIDIAKDDDDPMDEHCHGTHVAGIIAGQGNGGIQTGIAPGAKIMAVRVLDETGYGTDQDVIEGVEFAVEHGASIINISAGDSGVGACGFYRDLFTTVNDAGVVAAVAGGNDGTVLYTYNVPINISAPGNCPPPWLHPDQVNLISGGTTAVICVGATDSNDDHCDFSSVGPVTWAYGDYVGDYNDYPYQNGDASQPGLIRPDISAPGKNITSLNFQTGNQYIEYDGTSMATPCVAGVLALLLEAEPELLPAQLDSIIELTAVSAGNTVKNNIVGSGRIDALAAIDALYHHGPTNLTAEFDGTYVDLSWNEADNAVSYSLYRDGMRIANNLTTTTYTDNLSYGGKYTYYVKALLDNEMTTLPSNYVFIEKEIDVEAEVINWTRVSLSWNMPECTYDGFESGDLYQNMWINDGSYPWEVTMEDANSGSYCVKSTNKSMFSSSKITLGVTVPATCVVSYYAKVSCFPLNGGGFFIDNVQQGETLKDEIPWTRYTVALSAGNHLLEWKYGNQLAEGGYENSFYVDDITVGYPFNIYLMDCDSGDQTMLAENVVDAQYLDNEWANLPMGTYKYGVSADGGYTIAWSEALEKDYEGVDEIDGNMVSVYPNPAKDMLTIECAGAKRITIVSMLGEVVYDAAASSDIMTIDLGYYQSGMYFLNIVTEKGQLTKKITVSK